jgi:hypothetical protein
MLPSKSKKCLFARRNGFLYESSFFSVLFFIRYFEMEGSSISGRSGGWKNSINKNRTGDSRLLADNKEFPSKFSPAKHELQPTKVLGRSGFMSYSQDEIKLDGDRGR